MIYTTNAIESLNSAIKKRIKGHRIFSRDESAIKAVWLAVVQASKKWTMPLRDWKKALNYFYVKFMDSFFPRSVRIGFLHSLLDRLFLNRNDISV